MTDQVPARVGVFGGGRMGAGIAHAFVLAGSDVTVIEASAEAADAALARITASIAKSVERGTTSEAAEALTARLRVATEDSALADTDLVIEAVPEIPALKVDVIGRASKAAPGAVIASNTSSISIAELALAAADPARVLGLHFFNPVPASTLVEIVRTDATEPQLIEAAQGWVRGIGKTPIVVANSPGFASSRLGVTLGLEAIRMVEEGVASAADIDTAMVLGYKHPVGPLRLTDLVGLDVRLAIAEYLEAELGPRFAPPQLMRDMVAAGTLGHKTGQGFFDWSKDA